MRWRRLARAATGCPSSGWRLERTAPLLLPCLLFSALCLAAGGGIRAAEDSAAGGERKAFSLPGAAGTKALELTAGPGSVFGKEELLLKEYVDIRYGQLRLQADTVRYVPATKDCFAEGNVILDNGATRLTARRVEYNLDTEKGTFYEARGYAEPSFYFEAKEVRKTDVDHYVILEGTFTACTQPVPYWSFKVSRGTIHIDHYAYLHNVSFRLEHVPAFYSPYLVWPIKEDRATGLLFPEFGFSRRRGFVLTNALYWAIRRNMDATFFLDYYALAGVGEGLEYRYVPSQNGKGQVTASFIRDQVTDRDRYFFNLNHRQDLPGDFRLVAGINQVSDFNYFPDFQRDFRLSTNPVVLSNLYLTRNWSYYGLNLRAERRRQIFSVAQEFFPDPPNFPNARFETTEQELTNLIEPKVEIRGSRQRLGLSPLYFAFDASLDSFEKATTLFSTSYQRFDLFPTFSAPMRLTSWLDINPTVGIRDTYYSKRLGAILSEPLGPNGTPDPGEDVGLDGVPGTGDFGEGNKIVDRRQEIIDSDFVRKILQGSVEIIG
ncbi:MAG TPA: LPS assembly protein LptD, partial [Candidatus Polarisedimenticolia bacterium]|nr:LPS assembly protein LptD [Candidatus Polarisedimenticolia bacterium]